jgi:hypothetical protein
MQARRKHNRAGLTLALILALAPLGTIAAPAAGAAPGRAAPANAPLHQKDDCTGQDYQTRSLACRTLAQSERAATYTKRLYAVGKAQTIVLFFQSLFLLGTLAVAFLIAGVQLRAYIFIDDVLITRNYLHNRWDVKFILKNNGFTPAHRVYTGYVVAVVDGNPARVPVPAQIDYLGSIGPQGDTVDMCPALEGDIAYSDLDQDGKKIMLAGYATYRDMFKLGRRTSFCFYFPDKDGKAAGGQMSAYHLGNDAD